MITCFVCIIRPVSAILLCSFLLELIVPITAQALTSGPAQPEFSTFEPVATTSMVNEFTGAFTYNLPVLSIPGPDGGGYAMSLSYHSGVSAEEDASWVGYGWTLNPGAITRQTRGFPDDYKKASLTYLNKLPKNWTVSASKKLKTELFSSNPADAGANDDEPAYIKSGYAATASMTHRYNNFKGYSYGIGLSLDVKGMVNLGYSVNDGKGSFSLSINPGKILSELGGKLNKNPDEPMTAFAKLISSVWMPRPNYSASYNPFRAVYGHWTFGDEQRATNYTTFTGASYNADLGVEWNPGSIPVGVEVGLTANYSEQTPTEAQPTNAYGYMYSGSLDGSGVQDYYVETEAPYSKRDKFLGIPFTNADQFIVSGEGLGGAFRLYNRKVGEFGPRTIHSYTNIYQIGGELQFGSAMGGGGDLGIGYQTLDVNGWSFDDNDYKLAQYASDKMPIEDEAVFFRFNNDQGGSVEFADNDRPDNAYVTPVPLVSDKLPGSLYSSINKGKRSGRAGYIGYSTYWEMRKRPKAGCMQLGGEEGQSYFRSYNKDRDSRKLFETNYDSDKNKTILQDAVCEFATTNENGDQYTYGLPVFSRNEENLQYGLAGLTSSELQNKYLAFKSIDKDAAGSMVVGELRPDPYATTYLLTAITTPDYIDRNNDGPSADDLGGYTKFNYVRTAGSLVKDSVCDDWYRWRTPYRGMLYTRNSLSDVRDDRGSVTHGEKEIYYLESIETKTHIAKFLLNSPESPRLDGFEADHDPLDAMGNTGSTTADGSLNKLRRLERIELYAKKQNGGPGKLLNVVRLEYDYSLCGNLPNSKTVGQYTDGGKLTLKRVYFEHGGVREARVSPYVFGYEYRKASDYAALPASQEDTLYSSIIHFADSYVGHPEYENPDYSPFDTDRWGYYQRGGQYWFNNMNTWVRQRPDSKFDPAAWHLKWIKLPSGGEIHVQYEQHEYRYVQDREAMFMTPIRNAVKDVPGNIQNPVITDNTYRYYLNLDSMGVNDEVVGIDYSQQLIDLRDKLKKEFVDNDTRIYFRFLYSLDNNRDPDLESCASEYITGYAKVKAVELDRVTWKGMYIELETPDEDAGSHPINICQQFLRSSRQGIVDANGICDASINGIPQSEDPDPWAKIMDVVWEWGDSHYNPDECCSQLNLRHSYFRLPLGIAKKGGGIRVKRLLMYDPGIETGTSALYGTEYLYQDENGISSGVATNEPSVGREENALVTYLQKRMDQSALNKVIAGLDREQFEGPLGESILPGPSIGYSRVVSRSIYPGKNGTGFLINEYYTVKDYPFDRYYESPDIEGRGVQYTGVSDGSLIPVKTFGSAVNISVDYVKVSQGYSFIINNMHGQPKRMLSCGGQYIPRKYNVVASQQFDYYQPGESVLMIDSKGDTTRAFPGKEMEITMEGKEVSDMTVDANVEFDFTIGLAGFIPIPYLSIFPSVSINDEQLKTHVITKVVRYPALVKSVTVLKDGVTQKTENIAFNADNGKPVLTRMTDGYSSLRGPLMEDHDGSYYAMSFPASWHYPATGQIANNARKVIASKNGLHIDKGHYEWKHYLNVWSDDPINHACVADALSMLHPGDLIALTSDDRGQEYGVFHVAKIAGNQVELLPTYIAFANVDKKVDNTTIEIIRSGRSNQLGASIGAVTVYGRWPKFIEHPMP